MTGKIKIERKSRQNAENKQTFDLKPILHSLAKKVKNVKHRDYSKMHFAMTRISTNTHKKLNQTGIIVITVFFAIPTPFSDEFCTEPKVLEILT